MVQINFAKREVQCKIVYYGPEMAGKTTNLQQIYERSPAKVRGTLTTIATDTNRTLFFDFLPLSLGRVAKVHAKINLYAIPYIDGQNAVRLLVLEGADGIVFVADSDPERQAANEEALANLRENLNHLGRDPDEIPVVFQWNKRDHANAVAIEELQALLNPRGLPAFEATAETGLGIFKALKSITHNVLSNVSKMVDHPATAESNPAISHNPTMLPPTEPEPRPAPQPELEPVPEPTLAPEPELEPVHAAAAADDGFRTDFDDVALPPEEEPELLPAEATPFWRRSDEPKPAVASGSSQFQFEAPRADENAVPMPAAVAEPPTPPMNDVPRAADLDAGSRPQPVTSPLETETSIVEQTADGWDEFEDPAPPPPTDSHPEEEYADAGETGAYEPAQAREDQGYEEQDAAWSVDLGQQPPPTAPGRVRVGGAGYAHTWDSPSDYRPRPRGDARPVTERRRRPRLNTNIETLSDASLVTGSLFALFSLIVVGVLVHQLL